MWNGGGDGGVRVLGYTGDGVLHVVVMEVLAEVLQSLEIVHSGDDVIGMLTHDKIAAVSRVRADQNIGPSHRASRLHVARAIIQKQTCLWILHAGDAHRRLVRLDRMFRFPPDRSNVDDALEQIVDPERLQAPSSVARHARREDPLRRLYLHQHRSQSLVPLDLQRHIVRVR